MRRVAINLVQRGFVKADHDFRVEITPAGIDECTVKPEAPRASRTYNLGNITGSTLGDDSSINIATVTVGDILARLETEIKDKVSDPDAKKTLLARLSEIVAHPAFGGLRRLGLSELLRHLGDPAAERLAR